MVGVFYGDAHLAKVEHRVPPQVTAGRAGKLVEVAVAVQRRGIMGVLQVKELKLRTHVIGVAKPGQLFQVALQDLPRVSGKIFALGSPDVAEHPGHRVLLGAPRQKRKGGRIWKSSHIALVGPGKAFDGRTVETHAVVDSVFQIGDVDRESLEVSQDVRKPQPHELHVRVSGCLNYKVPLRRIPGHHFKPS